MGNALNQNQRNQSDCSGFHFNDISEEDYRYETETSCLESDFLVEDGIVSEGPKEHVTLEDHAQD